MKNKTRDHIIAYATKKFLEVGYSKVSTDELVSDLGISKSTLYKFFPKKDDLLDEMITSYFDGQNQELKQIMENQDSDFLVKVSLLLNTVGKRLSSVRKEALNDMKRSAPDAFERIMVLRKTMILEKITVLFQEGADRGLFRQDIDQSFVVRVLLTAIETMADPENLVHSSYSIEDVFRNVLAIVLEGNLTRPD
jgi:AcrR family transcriptional regulator